MAWNTFFGDWKEFRSPWRLAPCAFCQCNQSKTMWSKERFINWLRGLDAGSLPLQKWLLACIFNTECTYSSRTCLCLCLKWQQGLFVFIDIYSFSQAGLNIQFSFYIGNSFFSIVQHYFLFQDQLMAFWRKHQKHGSWHWNAGPGSQFHSYMWALASPELQGYQCFQFNFT